MLRSMMGASDSYFVGRATGTGQGDIHDFVPMGYSTAGRAQDDSGIYPPPFKHDRLPSAACYALLLTAHLIIPLTTSPFVFSITSRITVFSTADHITTHCLCFRYIVTNKSFSTFICVSMVPA